MSFGQQNLFVIKLGQIHFIQESIREPDWIKKLFLVQPIKDTIPFLLYLKNGNPFYAFGNIGKLDGERCFTTPFFRIEDIQGCHAVLSLLYPVYCKPSKENPICNLSHLEKTSYCVDVDLSMVGAIQFLCPDLVC